ncbi:hypothetical protein SEEHRA36_19572 [Salmonella enterica subsp. enterica serovar Heidelberg str. SARA36]|nr:hypothetical protein SEEHRA36_19572 [Salmonella enterica subsp. enterica serovar Heidelberg str. SARA36]
MLFCKQHAAVALFPYLWIDGIPDNHTQQDSQGQGAEPRACNQAALPPVQPLFGKNFHHSLFLGTFRNNFPKL